MARNKQTGPEIKLYQIDTMLYLGTKNIITKLSMFAEFLKDGGVAIADQLNLNRARALERYEKNYKISDIKELTTDGQANETWLRKNGLLYSVDGKYELSPIANAIIREKITLADYCFLLLSKQWIKVKELGGKDEYKANLLSVILDVFIKSKSISVGDFVSRINQIALDKYKDEYKGLALSNQDGVRYLIEPLLISKLIEEKKGVYVLNPNMKDLAADYVNNTKQIKRIDQVACADEEYWNSFQYGFYDLINKENEPLYTKHYPHLFAMKELYKDNGTLPLQQIFYGAPGTGKSNTIKREVDEKGLPNVRTTFHPDSDYSSFVGAYKPTSIEVPSRDVTGKVIIENGQKVTENRIVYEFVPQAFLKAYTGAWKNQGKPFFLIIEEINRGNCAQIFGDLFQLLDRKNGESEYPISPDEDIQKFLKTDKKFGFAALTEEEKAGIPSEILSGELLKLPKNLYIWATMNTSDQSLFPIDSAFKRRWDWKYIPITEGMGNGAPLKWKFNVNGKFYDWWQFVVKINDEINEQTKSEDKKLGYFFCKAKNGIISADTFVSKVIFYLWNDVFKDQAFGNSIFVDGDDELTFNSFFGNRNGETTIKEEKVEVFLQNLGVVAEGNADEGVTDEIADENAKKQRKEILVSIQIPGNPTILASESSPFESFIKALRIIGLDKVESSLPSLKYKRLDCPVISTQKYDGIANNDKGYSYYKEGNLYIVKGCKSYTYIRILEELDKIYNIGLSMESK